MVVVCTCDNICIVGSSGNRSVKLFACDVSSCDNCFDKHIYKAVAANYNFADKYPYFRIIFACYKRTFIDACRLCDTGI